MNAISPKLLNMNLDQAQKNLFFWSNSDKIEIKEIEMLLEIFNRNRTLVT